MECLMMNREISFLLHITFDSQGYDGEFNSQTIFRLTCEKLSRKALLHSYADLHILIKI